MFYLEVLPEMAAISSVWATFLIVGGLGLVLSSTRWWLAIPTLGLLVFFSVAFSLDLYGDLYPAIMREDRNYILLLNLAILTGFALNIAGIAVYFVRRSHRIP